MRTSHLIAAGPTAQLEGAAQGCAAIDRVLVHVSRRIEGRHGAACKHMARPVWQLGAMSYRPARTWPRHHAHCAWWEVALLRLVAALLRLVGAIRLIAALLLRMVALLLWIAALGRPLLRVLALLLRGALVIGRLLRRVVVVRLSDFNACSRDRVYVRA